MGTDDRLDREIAPDVVRAVLLAAQGFGGRRDGATKEDVRGLIRQMHALQIDTINVVARSPYLALWSRLGDYDSRWLDALLAEGELMVARRENFQRVYDLHERVLPGWDDAKVPPVEQVNQQFVLNSVQALGISRPEWIADYIRLGKADAAAALKELTRRGAVRTVPVRGWSTPGYYHPANEKLILAAADGLLPVAPTTLLSPFDPVVSDRARALDL